MDAREKAQRILKHFELPMLILATCALLLYMMELFRLIPPSLTIPSYWLNLIIDSIFCIDITAKIIINGKKYIKSPWFIIDVVSTAPIFSSIMDIRGLASTPIEAARAARGARITRIARTARIAKVAKATRAVKAVRFARGLTFLKSLPKEVQETPSFSRALKLGVPMLLVLFITMSYHFQQQEISQLKKRLFWELRNAKTVTQLTKIPGYMTPQQAADPLSKKIWLPKEFNRQNLMYAFSIEPALKAADRIQGYFMILLLVSVFVTAYITNNLAKDQQTSQKDFLLKKCFSPQIVEKFNNAPEMVEKYYKQWMCVFFIDIKGFTKSIETASYDIEGLAIRLRRVMDIARKEIVESHEGIVDKFIGDAIMGWIGGHFSKHWEIIAHYRKMLCLDEQEACEQDIKSLEREIIKQEALVKTLDDEDDIVETKNKLKKYKKALKNARAERIKFIKLNKQIKKNNPNLKQWYDDALTEYKQTVAEAAVQCCLNIIDKVAKQEGDDSFKELKIGIASGNVLVGNFGSTDQVGFTVLGSSVNRAARLEPASGRCGSKVLVDETTYDLLKDSKQFSFRLMPRIKVKGIDQELSVYEPFREENITKDFLNAFHEGVGAIREEDYKLAIDFFKKAKELRSGGDKPSAIWIEECNKALEEGYSIKVKTI